MFTESERIHIPHVADIRIQYHMNFSTPIAYRRFGKSTSTYHNNSTISPEISIPFSSKVITSLQEVIPCLLVTK